jgi:hypothetical protein
MGVTVKKSIKTESGGYGAPIDVSRIDIVTDAMIRLKKSFANTSASDTGGDLQEFLSTFSLFINRITGNFSNVGNTNITKNLAILKKAIQEMADILDPAKDGVDLEAININAFSNFATGIGSLGDSLRKLPKNDTISRLTNMTSGVLDFAKNFDEAKITALSGQFTSVAKAIEELKIDTDQAARITTVFNALNRLGTGNKTSSPTDKIRSMVAEFTALKEFFVKAETELVEARAKAEEEAAAKVEAKTKGKKGKKAETPVEDLQVAELKKVEDAGKAVTKAIAEQATPAKTLLDVIKLQVAEFTKVRDIAKGITAELKKMPKAVKGEEAGEVKAEKKTTKSKAKTTAADKKEETPVVPDAEAEGAKQAELQKVVNKTTDAFILLTQSIQAYLTGAQLTVEGTDAITKALTGATKKAKEFAKVFSSEGIMANSVNEEQMNQIVEASVERMSALVDALKKAQSRSKSDQRKELTKVKQESAAAIAEMQAA